MANIKSAKKRILVSAKKAMRNKAAKSAVKTQIKKVDSAIAAADKDLAAQELNNLKSILNKTASKGILKKSTVARKISRMALAVEKIGK
ncbi:MAG: 30S ribosomal protein S20 [Lachnospiraceae bacterium]|nr:30S ribosomal protein S20 [Candidatus Equihabitans merdae]